MEKENNYYYEPTIKTARKPFIHNETGVKIGEEVTTTYKICTNDCISKKQLISFLENKIKEYETMYVDNDEALIVLQEVLDFINKGGKE